MVEVLSVFDSVSSHFSCSLSSSSPLVSKNTLALIRRNTYSKTYPMVSRYLSCSLGIKAHRPGSKICLKTWHRLWHVFVAGRCVFFAQTTQDTHFQQSYKHPAAAQGARRAPRQQPVHIFGATKHPLTSFRTLCRTDTPVRQSTIDGQECPSCVSGFCIGTCERVLISGTHCGRTSPGNARTGGFGNLGATVTSSADSLNFCKFSYRSFTHPPPVLPRRRPCRSGSVRPGCSGRRVRRRRGSICRRRRTTSRGFGE